MIESEASSGFVKLTAREVYRVNRIRIARIFHIDPRIVDDWDAQTYYDSMDVDSADSELAKLK